MSPISAKHPNRRQHNWLAYDLSDIFLQRFKRDLKGHVYDLGCGEAPYRDWLLQHADAYIGVDWADSLHQLKADIIADLNERLPIKSGVADTVVSLSVLEHLREPLLFLSEAYRILKPGGNMVLQVPFMWWVHEAPYDYFRYTCHGLEYLFKKAGFVHIEIFPQTGFWAMWILKFNYQSTRLIRGPWPLRHLIALALRTMWAVDQRIAPWLDKHWPSEGETAGYFVLARKV